MTKVKLTPSLRFLGFYENWKDQSIGDYYKNLRTGMTPSRSIPKYYNGQIPWITSGELDYNEIYETKEYITEEAVRNTNLKIYPPNTFFIAITGLEAPGTRGRCAINMVPAATNQSCMAFEEIETIHNKFLFYWYNRFGIELYYGYAQGTKQQSFNNKIVEKFIFRSPSLPEQKKIATFLSAVEKKLEKLQQKKTFLENYKKGVMQQLFSQALRFKNEDGSDYPDWEEKRLGKIGKIVNGLTYSPNDIDENGVLVLRSSNVKDRTIVLEDNVFVNVSEGSFNPVIENDILICVRNGSKRLIGKNAIISKSQEGLAFGAFMTVYRSIYNSFLFHYFDSEDYKKEVHKNLGATINSINGSDLKKFKVPFPNKEEQAKIANFLSALDKKIELVTNQIENSQQFKKGLLQQMFV